MIAIIHYEHHWSFTVINIKEGKIQMYDSMEKVGHKEANEKLKSSLEEILRKKQQKEWTLERMHVPQQTDSESLCKSFNLKSWKVSHVHPQRGSILRALERAL